MKILQKKKPGRSTTVDQPGFFYKNIKLDFSPSRKSLKPAPQDCPSRSTLMKDPHEYRPSKTLITLKVVYSV